MHSIVATDIAIGIALGWVNEWSIAAPAHKRSGISRIKNVVVNGTCLKPTSAKSMDFV